MTDAADAFVRRPACHGCLREPILVRGRPIPLRASLGIALSDSVNADVDALIRDADVAMYIAKKRGGGRYDLFEASMRAGVADRLKLKMDLRRALAQRQLVVHYQPTVNLATREIVGAEALLR